ncbi:unnamed protein product [Prorocentrum cordatum]|uniref:Protein kinase domain-containing protein n=1 Tax=Prorocentrum cordatum TaxID=2364126 RepID=A0ABN9T2Y5_9DINO|nr:unnamed protein product [Polarella glacialis]
MVAAAGPRGGGDSPLLSARVASGRQLYLLEDLVKVGGPLGSGSFGQVTKVVHKKTAEIYAMKVIPKAKVEEFEMDSYLEREIKTQLQVQHPNILRLYQAFEDEEDSVHLLLEYANGGSLFGVLRRSAASCPSPRRRATSRTSQRRWRGTTCTRWASCTATSSPRTS